MAEFSTIMNQARAMCSMTNKNPMCCKACPLHDHLCKLTAGQMTAEDLRIVENEVQKWAAIQKKPIYPTWGEWLENIGLAFGMKDKNNGTIVYVLRDKEVGEQIPENIAQNLKLQPVYEGMDEENL